jgi:hypothetical protein
MGDARRLARGRALGVALALLTALVGGATAVSARAGALSTLTVWERRARRASDSPLQFGNMQQLDTRGLTPCSIYNDRHAVDGGNCEQCTHTYFRLPNPRENEYVMAQDRSLEWFPVKRAVIGPLRLDGTFERCMWCPQKQLCGHSSDWRVDCDHPNGTINAGWLSQEDCVDTRTSSRDKYSELEKVVNADVEGMNDADRKAFLTREAYKANFSADLDVRETAQVHDHDASFDCFGECVQYGNTQCSEFIKRVLVTMEEEDGSVTILESDKPSPTAVRRVSAGPVACRFNVEFDHLTPMRAWGRYRTKDREWEFCRLLPCRPLVGGSFEVPPPPRDPPPPPV